MKKAAVLIVLLLLSGCTRPLPPHVWMPIRRVEFADLFWYTDLQICNLRVMWWDDDEPRSFTVRIHEQVCVERLKSEGYQVPERTP